jgi:superfamily II DNA/RNA helicase
VIASSGPTIVFCRTKRGADRVARQLEQTGLRTAAIHGDRSQGQRERALEAFHRGSIDALIATDVAARGIHVDGVSAVIHLDPPADEKDYVHRSGRTGRAGAQGVVVTFVAPELRKDVTKMQKILKMTPGITAPDTDALPVIDRPVRKVRPTAPRHDDAPRAARPGGPRTSRRTGAPRRGYSSDGSRSRDGETRSDRPSRPSSSTSSGAKPARSGRPGQPTPTNAAGNRQIRRAHLQTSDGDGPEAGSRKSRRSDGPNPDKGKRRQPTNPQI